MVSRRAFLGLGLAGGVAALSGGIVWSRFSADIKVHRARVSQGSAVISLPFGQMEYATAGQGLPVLAIHGAGGGFDQILGGAKSLLAPDLQIIAPSRFGYLRSTSPADPTPENQADAYIFLLDHLGIEKVAVVGVSAGALSALQFASRHPDRCRSLTLIVPAASTSEDMHQGEGQLPAPGPITRTIIETTLKSDLMFWLSTKVARDQTIRSILATDPAIIATADPRERQRADDMLDNILPITERSEGLRNDGRFAGQPRTVDYDRIKVPSFVISLEDDLFGTAIPARYIAGRIAGARLLIYESGGHIWIGHNDEMFAAVVEFIRQSG